MISPDSGRIQVLVSEIEKMTGDLVIVIVSDLFRQPGNKSVDMALKFVERIAADNKEGGNPGGGILVILQGSAKFSRQSLMKMRLLADSFPIRFMPAGSISSLFTAFVSVGQCAGNSSFYDELGVSMFNIPMQDLVVDFTEITSGLQFFPVDTETMRHLPENWPGTSRTGSSSGSIALNGYSESLAFNSYLVSLKSTFGMDDSLIGKGYGIEPVSNSIMKFVNLDVEMKSLPDLVRELRQGLSSFTASIDEPFLAIFGSSISRYKAGESGEWQ